MGKDNPEAKKRYDETRRQKRIAKQHDDTCRALGIPIDTKWEDFCDAIADRQCVRLLEALHAKENRDSLLYDRVEAA